MGGVKKNNEATFVGVFGIWSQYTQRPPIPTFVSITANKNGGLSRGLKGNNEVLWKIVGVSQCLNAWSSEFITGAMKFVLKDHLEGGNDNGRSWKVKKILCLMHLIREEQLQSVEVKVMDWENDLSRSLLHTHWQNKTAFDRNRQHDARATELWDAKVLRI